MNIPSLFATDGPDRNLSIRYGLAIMALLALILPFLGKPPHIDDPNFRILAEGARADWWRPHDVRINWMGTTQRAFEVLSNPPGIGWWLAPVLRLPMALQHLWMLPWLVPFCWGAAKLGKRFAGAPLTALLLIGTCPILVLSAGSFHPDLPLVALMLSGTGGYIDATDQGRPGRAFLWATVAGASFLFRYSGITMLPLLALYSLLQRRNPWPALGALLPVAALWGHDLSAYGEFHFTAMIRFQRSHPGWIRDIRKGVALLAILGGCLAPFGWPGGRRWVGAGVALGLAAGLAGTLIGGLALWPSLWTFLLCTAGGGTLAATFERCRAFPRQRDGVFLALWAVAGIAFLVSLQFMASRYWLPFLAPVILVMASRGLGKTVVALAISLQFSLSLALAVDDYQFARAQETLAIQITEAARRQAPGAPRFFSGHWGWQEAMAARGWVPVEEGGQLPPGSILAMAETPWPQAPAPGLRFVTLWQAQVPCSWWGPRTHTFRGKANLFTFTICNFSAGLSPTFAPWGFGRDSRERVALFQVAPSTP